MAGGMGAQRLLGSIAFDVGGVAYERRLDRERAEARARDATPISRDRRDRIDLHSSEFKRWFKGSAMLEKSGAPRLFYHGTAADCVEFDPVAAAVTRPLGGNAFFFSTNRPVALQYGRNLMVCCLQMRKPLVAEPGALRVDWSHPHDGGILLHENPRMCEYLVSNPSQIKLIRRERARWWE